MFNNPKKKLIPTFRIFSAVVAKGSRQTLYSIAKSDEMADSVTKKVVKSAIRYIRYEKRYRTTKMRKYEKISKFS